jgi:hypothetical protein
MQIFTALDQYDNVIRSCATKQLAEIWLKKRADATWSAESLGNAKWSESDRGESWLTTEPSESHPDGMQWPYRILEQPLMEAELTSATIIRGES